MKRRIAYYGDPMLRKKCAPIGKITPEIKEIANDLLEMAVGVSGMAAPQIFEPVRMFAAAFIIYDKKGQMTWDEDGKAIYDTPRIYINPELTDPSKETELHSEGCVSIGLYVPVERPYAITIKAMDLEGNTFEERVEGFNARILMHENDHLNGVLNIDRMTHADKKRFEPELKRLKKEYKKQSK